MSAGLLLSGPLVRLPDPLSIYGFNKLSLHCWLQRCALTEFRETDLKSSNKILDSKVGFLKTNAGLFE